MISSKPKPVVSGVVVLCAGRIERAPTGAVRSEMRAARGGQQDSTVWPYPVRTQAPEMQPSEETRIY